VTTPRRLLVVGVAALSAVGALGLTAAQGGRGLDWNDLRSVVIVSVAVALALYLKTPSAP
jgi:hypothetical protein